MWQRLSRLFRSGSLKPKLGSSEPPRQARKAAKRARVASLNLLRVKLEVGGEIPSLPHHSLTNDTGMIRPVRAMQLYGILFACGGSILAPEHPTFW